MTGSTEACPTCALVVDLDNYERILSSNDFSIPDNLNPYIHKNLFPTSTICTEIKQSLGRLEKQFSSFEQVLAHQQMAISQVASILKNYEEAYANTRSEQLCVQEIMDLHKAALSSPIRSLPDDLLVFIFRLASPNAAFMDQFPWIATRVCRQWRAVAHSNRILWSEFNLDYVSISEPLYHDSWRSSAWGESHHDGWNPSSWEQPVRHSGQRGGWNREPCARRASLEGERERKRHEKSRPAISQRVVRQALSYSGNVPLTFSLDFVDVPWDSHKIALGYLDVLTAQAARWRNVKLRLKGSLFENLSLVKNCLPMLETLDLYLPNDRVLPFPTDVFVNTPSLHTLTLTLCSPTEFIFPWKQLKELSIYLQSPLSENYYLQILRNGSLLETFRLQADLLRDFETNLHTHRVTTLSYLRVLEIDSEFSSLLNSICLPKLSSLTVCGNADSMELDLSSLIERSHSVVEKLSYSSTSVRDSFIRLLRVFSSLTSLTLHVPNLGDKAFFYTMAQKSLLPSLEDFTIDMADISYDYMMPIIDMLAARQSCLKRFHLTLTLTNDDEIHYAEDWSGTWESWDQGTPSTTSQTSRDGWLAPSEKARLRALSNEGMKIRIGLYEYHAQGGPEMSYVNLSVE
ncbi:hypothetical protein ARMSODRAFT_952262 [Armillaria solidipes]|uniref:F-box domain-containing protein n=1 Tax=Armillaria solidipes TaxID=1076256 RepID=A0A2H3CD79_9AGAR|nr:hypothetical protein ARMSODRAFT_952262 [Armillaria solidipes]